MRVRCGRAHDGPQLKDGELSVGVALQGHTAATLVGGFVATERLLAGAAKRKR